MNGAGAVRANVRRGGQKAAKTLAARNFCH